MEYITSSTDETADKAKSGKIKLIHNRVKKIRKSEKMGVKYMQLWEEMAYAREEGLEEGRAVGLEEGRAVGLEEGRTEGRAEGERKKLIQIICRMLQKDKTPEEIAENLEESADYVKEIYQAAEKCAYDCDEIYAELSGL